jgi:hypothetical protein
MSIYKKLNEARQKFHALDLKKSGENKFAGYKYFELGDFLVPGMRVLADVGLCAYVSFETEHARMTIVDVENPQEQIVIFSPMSSANLKGCHPVQNIGAVESYQRRYLWMAALEVVENDIIDASEPVKEDKKKTITPNDGAMEALTREQKALVYKVSKAIKDAFAEQDDWKAYGEWTSLADADIAKGVWSQLDAKIRASIKSMKEAEENQPATVE